MGGHEQVDEGRGSDSSMRSSAAWRVFLSRCWPTTTRGRPTMCDAHAARGASRQGGRAAGDDRLPARHPRLRPLRHHDDHRQLRCRRPAMSRASDGRRNGTHVTLCGAGQFPQALRPRREEGVLFYLIDIHGRRRLWQPRLLQGGARIRRRQSSSYSSEWGSFNVSLERASEPHLRHETPADIQGLVELRHGEALRDVPRHFRTGRD